MSNEALLYTGLFFVLLPGVVAYWLETPKRALRTVRWTLLFSILAYSLGAGILLFNVGDFKERGTVCTCTR